MLLFYPLFLLASLYGQWLLSWAMLGHMPRPSLDDPKDIAGAACMHPITGLTLLAFPPAAVLALSIDAFYAVASRPLGRGVAPRAALFLLLWAGASALIAWNPGRGVYWWLD